MPIMRNPFRRQDENVRPVTSGADKTPNGTPTKPITIEKEEPTEYKLSEINDSGVFVPPSPPERKSFWTTSSSRSTTSTHRSLFDENEPFNISRESFDSYRRSFDISARSPVIIADSKPPRASLDSRTFLPPPRHSNSFHRPLQVPGTQKEEEPDALEDVALDDPKPQPPPKKRGMFSRILDSDSHSDRPASQDAASKGSSWHHFGGRKRGQSGQGAELGTIPKREDTPKPESQLKKEERRASLNTPAEPESQSKKSERRASAAAPTETQSKKDDRHASIHVPAERQSKKEEGQATPGAEKPQAPEIRVDSAALR